MPERQTNEWPELITVDAVRGRLAQIFPADFPDRALLVGQMAARVVYVFLYGAFVEPARLLRPSAIYFFTEQQAQRNTAAERLNWLAHVFRPGHRPPGDRWYADTSRESIRDDLIRGRLLPMGVVLRQEGVATTSSAPVYRLAPAFAELFDARLADEGLMRAIDAWRGKHLAPSALKRMSLRASGALLRRGDVHVQMPDGSRMRMAGGPSTPILKAMIEDFAPRWLREPAVLWVSASDEKAQPQFTERALRVGLRFDTNLDLPDLILVDLAEPLRFYFCEIVASDGPVTEERRSRLSALAHRGGIEADSLRFVTAFEDRGAAPFKKVFSRVALDSDLWFSTEPELLVSLRRQPV